MGKAAWTAVTNNMLVKLYGVLVLAAGFQATRLKLPRLYLLNRLRVFLELESSLTTHRLPCKVLCRWSRKGETAA